MPSPKAGPYIHVTDFGSTEQVGLRLKNMALAAVDTIVPMHEIAADMLRIERVTFKLQGARGKGVSRWTALKPDTVRKKGSTRILFTEGAKEGYSALGSNTLFRSVTVPDAPYQDLTVSKKVIFFGTKRPWATVHQYGSSKHPPRPFMYVLPGDIARWDRLLFRHLLKPFLGKVPYGGGWRGL